MSTLSDGTIHQTIHKQAGHGPYLWALTRCGKDGGESSISIFSFWADAARAADAFESNGWITSIDLAVDNTRKVSDAPIVKDVFGWELKRRPRTR